MLTTDLRELYQEIILDHGRRPRNFHDMDPCDAEATGHNPLCGDRCRVFLRLRDGVITEASFSGNGCAISTASASLMTQAVTGKTTAEAEALFEAFHAMTTGTSAPGGEAVPETFDKLTVFAGVREFPSRVKCATLPWHTLKAAITHAGDTVTTE